jgi:hypothetical protein
MVNSIVIVFVVTYIRSVFPLRLLILAFYYYSELRLCAFA